MPQITRAAAGSAAAFGEGGRGEVVAPRDEGAQEDAAEALLEEVLRSLALAGGANVTLGDPYWTVPSENTFGAEIIVPFEFQHPLFDVPVDVGRPTPNIIGGFVAAVTDLK